MRFELFVALRYLFARRKQAFIYIISAMSVLGVAIGVAALVVVLGVYNGFTTDIRDKILGANAHIIVSGPLAALTAPPSDADFEKMRGGEAPELSGMAAVLRRINATPGVVGSTPFLYAEGMLSSPRGVKGVVLRGIDPKTAPDVLTMLDNLSSGSVADLNASVEGAPPGVLIGKELAQRLGLVVGSRVNLLSPSGQKTTAGFQPRIRPYKVAGIFQTGMFEYDSSLGFISLAAARDLLGLPSDQISGIEVTVKDVYKADTVAAALQKELGPLASVRTWMDMNANLFAALKLEKIDVFDLYVPIVEDVDYPIAFEDAKELVKKATLPLGEEYQKLLDRAFAERWVDVYENDGKQSGAFSCGVFGVHPYVLMNFAGTLNDAFTLAHELGHSMHSWFSDTTQDYVNHDYRIMVAEVASTVNEVLLTKYLLKTETDEKRRAYILNHFLESFRTTLYRQTLFAEFERKAHDLYAAGQPLTATSLNKVYHDLEATYYDGIGIDADIDPEWSYIPHFYRAFYVYQYATGFSSAVAIAEHILTTGDASGYLKFLTTGGSDYPLEELKIAGVDLTKPDTVRSALRVFDETIDELAKILL